MIKQKEQYQKTIAHLQKMLDEILTAQHKTSSVTANLYALRQLSLTQFGVQTLGAQIVKTKVCGGPCGSNSKAVESTKTWRRRWCISLST